MKVRYVVAAWRNTKKLAGGAENSSVDLVSTSGADLGEKGRVEISRLSGVSRNGYYLSPTHKDIRSLIRK